MDSELIGHLRLRVASDRYSDSGIYAIVSVGLALVFNDDRTVFVSPSDSVRWC